jgi:hypothetical protein
MSLWVKKGGYINQLNSIKKTEIVNKIGIYFRAK